MRQPPFDSLSDMKANATYFAVLRSFSNHESAKGRQHERVSGCVGFRFGLSYFRAFAILIAAPPCRYR